MKSRIAFTLRTVVVCTGLLALVPAAFGEVILEYFNTNWKEITSRMPELAEAGYSALWLPPPFKGTSIWDVGYGTSNRFDFGSQLDPITNSVSTMYGTAADLIHMVEVAHRFGIRVYFDNVMAQNGGPIPGYDANTSIYVQPGFVPEDFHLKVQPDGTYRNWPTDIDYSNVWQVLNRNPFGLDIAQEDPNVNFGATEGSTFPKYHGIRHPNNPELYPDLNAPIDVVNPATGVHFNVYTFDGHGTPVSEDVNSMLFRAVRWFIDQSKCDGFRLDEVKSVPDYFFGKESGSDKNYSDWGYCGQIQEQFNITHGYSDWDNHRDTVFSTDAPRDDAMLFGEHLAEPPSRQPYVDAGMRIADDEFLNSASSALSYSLAIQDYSGRYLDQPGYGTFGGANQGVVYCMSHDNNYIWEGHYTLAHALLMTGQTLPIVYTDGFHHSTAPNWFPKPSDVPFLGQFNTSSTSAGANILNELYINQHFARGDQISKRQDPNYHDQNYVAYERRDKSENASMSDADGTVLLFMMARIGSGGQTRGITTTFPQNAPLYNYSTFGGGFYAYPQSDGTLKDSDGNPIIVPDGGYFAFSWRSPEQSDLWQNNSGMPLTILQNGTQAGTMTYLRTDGPNGDPNFNPYGVSGAVAGSYAYPMTVPRITDGSNLSFIARADASTENILMKLDGGMDINSQMGIGPQTGDLRDNRPALSRDTFLGYEATQFVAREYGEKFAAVDTTRCKFGSSGAETYLVASGTYNAGPTWANSYDNEGGNVASWLYHEPGANTDQSVKQYIDNGDGTVSLWAKTNNVGGGFRMWVYYTSDGTNPEGGGGVGLGTTTAVEMHYNHNDSGSNNWWGTSPPITKPAGDFRYKISIYKDTVSGSGSSPVSSIFPIDSTSIYRKKHGMTTFRITNFNATTKTFYPHNDYGVTQTGLSQGFHVLRTRTFLNRAGRASIYNTNTLTFYYDTQLPAGQVVYPANDGDSVGGQQYGVVVRTDDSVTDVQYQIVDGDSTNDDSATGVANGNGAWVEAAQLTANPAITSQYPYEWRFNYVNIPSSGTAQIKVRLRKLSSSTDNALSDTAGHFMTLTRTVNTNGPTIKMFVAYPQSDGQVVGSSYTMKVQFSHSLGNNLSTQDLINKFLITIASSESGSGANPVAQPRSGYFISGYNVNGSNDPNKQLDELAYQLPNLYNGVPNFLHTITVTFSQPVGNPALVATRLVKFYPQVVITNNIVTPPELDAQNKQYQIVLPDVANPTIAQRTVPIQVLTDTNATSVAIAFNIGTVSGSNIVLTGTNLSGSSKEWDFNWLNVQQGTYQFTSTVTTPGGTANATRDASVIIRQLVTNPVKGDTDDDGLSDTIETTGTSVPSNPSSDQVHLAMISGKTNPNMPDTDGDGLSDGLELGWATAIGDTNTTTDTNGDGVPNFQPDLDPPIYNTTDMAGAPSGQDYSYYNPWPYNSNNSATDQIAGTMTDPNNPDTDYDGLNDGVEDSTYLITTNTNGSLNYRAIHNGRVDIGVTGTNGVMTVIAHPPTVYNTSKIDRAKVLAKSPGAVWLETDPNNQDTTGCGLSDGDANKDANHNGIVDLAIIDRNHTDGNGNYVVLATFNDFKQSVTVQGTGTNAQPVTLRYSDFCYTYVEPTDGKTYTSTALDKTRLNNVFRPGGQIRSDGLDVIWLELDPRRFSTSDDGLPDGWKVQHGLNAFDDGVIGHYNLHTGKVITSTINGPGGDPDGDGFTNLQEYINGTDPQTADTGVAPPAGSITIGTGTATTVGGVTNNHEFTDWTANDLIALDYYDGDGPNNSGGDIYHAKIYDGFESSRDMVAFYARDGGAVAQGGDGNFYFRVDMNDLQAYAESSSLNIFVAINFGHPGTGEYNLPEEVDTGTTMGWQAVVACYQSNAGVVYLWDQNSPTHSTAIGQDLSQFGVTARNQNTASGFGKAYFNSDLDAVEFSISRQALIDAGWNGLDASDLTYQVYTTKDFTGDNPVGGGDISGRSDIRDSIRNDWIASDYWADQVNIDGAKSVLTQYVGLKADNDLGKRVKVISLIHGNQAIQPGSTIQSLINTGGSAGYYRPLDVHQAYNVPLTMHITPTLASAIQWAKVDPNSTRPYRDGPALNARIAGLIGNGNVDLIGGTFSDHILPYFSKPFNRDNVALANEFLTNIYGHAPSANVFWTPERVLDDGVLDKVNDLGFGYTFMDQMRHVFKWFGRSSALSTDGYRLNQINNTKCFVINDALGGYLFQNDDKGLPIVLRQVLQHIARTGPNDQIVTLFNNWEDFANKTYADAYDKNIAWMANHPWIQIVTPDQIASGQIDTSVPPTGIGGFGTVNRGTGLTLAKVAKDWLDHATEENYDNWYLGSAIEEGLISKVFNIRFGVALTGSYGQIGTAGGLADSAWNSVLALSASNGMLSKLARGTLHASVFETAFHNQTANDLSKFSTGAYVYPDTSAQNLADFSKQAQSQSREAAIYAKVDAWANAARSGTYDTTAVAEQTDIDLDGENEYLLYNDRIFAMFERLGGRMTNAWVRDISTGEVFQALGNPCSYAGSETEEEGNVHLDATSGQLAYRTSGFKDWFAQTGGAGVGTNTYVNNYYTVVTATNGAGWTFTSSDGNIAKAISIAPRASTLSATYNLSGGVNTIFVRFGMSPNLYDLLLNGQLNLSGTSDTTNKEISVLDTTPQQRIVRAFVKYGTGSYNAQYNSAAVDRVSSTSFDTINMRNQAQTQQLEIQGTNNVTFAVGFQTGPTVSISTANDGIPDWWKQQYGLSTTGTNVADADTDGDGKTNLQEYILNTNPTAKDDGMPRPRVSRSGNNFTLTFPTIADRLYRVYFTNNLASGWTQIPGDITGTGAPATWTDDGSQTGSAPALQPRRFYKIDIRLP